MSSAKNASPWVENTKTDERVDIYNDSKTGYIPLAQIPKMWRTKSSSDLPSNDLPSNDLPIFYGPETETQHGKPFGGNTLKGDVENDFLLKVYIGSISVLGVLILYQYYERS
jgi:hypothetical protein